MGSTSRLNNLIKNDQIKFVVLCFMKYKVTRNDIQHTNVHD